MHKICLLLLIMSSSVFPAAHLLIRSIGRSPIAVNSTLSLPVHAGLFQQQRMKSKKTLAVQVPELAEGLTQPSATEFLHSFKRELDKIDPSLLSLLRYRGFDRELDDSHEMQQDKQKVFWHTYEKYRVLAAATLFGEDLVDVRKAVEQAVAQRDPETMVHLLACRASLNKGIGMGDAVNLAIHNDDVASLRLLLEAGSSVCSGNIKSFVSLDMLHFLLDQGVRETDPWFGHSLVRALYPSSIEDPNDAEKLCLLKKMMLAVNSEATPNPYVGGGGYLLDSYVYHDDAKAFSELFIYLQAADTMRIKH